MVGHGKTARAILYLIYVTYTNVDILLNWMIEDKTPPLIVSAIRLNRMQAKMKKQ